jgi:hypothetical protein
MLLGQVDVELPGRFLDIGEGELTVIVRHANCLVRTRDRAAHMARRKFRPWPREVVAGVVERRRFGISEHVLPKELQTSFRV